MIRLLSIILAAVLFPFTSWAAVKDQHPRLYLTDTRMATMQAAALTNSAQWQRLVAFADGSYYSPSKQNIINKALVYKIKKANGDANANTYRDAAISKIMSVVEYGTSTGIDGYKLTDSSKNWTTDYLLNLGYWGINPDITQSKIFRINYGWQSDSAYTHHTATQYYIYPDPSGSLGLTMLSPRSEFASSATPGGTYVIFPLNPDVIKESVHGVAIGFDWLYDDLTTQQRSVMVAWMYGVARFMMEETGVGPQSYAWTNYTLDYISDLTAIAYAIYGYDTTKANEILSYVATKYNGGIKDSLLWSLQGGGWLEGDGYGAAILDRLTEFLDHGQTAEGLDRWSDFADVLKARLLYSMHMTYPKIKTGNYGVQYREIIANGDGARDWQTAYDYLRKSMLMIINHYPGESNSKIAQTFLSDTTNQSIFPFSSGWEFMFYNPNQATLPLSNAPLQNVAINSGMVQMRSGWDSGATQATFKSGPKTAYHSHLDANSFTIFKNEDLAPDTGAYPGSGGSEHGVNYFTRTIAHNAVVLDDPAENSWAGALQGNDYTVKVNDGGQRNVVTYNVDGSIKKIGSWQTTGLNSGSYSYNENQDIYKMGAIAKYSASSDYVYTVGDATNGYDGDTHKTTQVLRKFLYLRPDFFIVYDKIKTKDTTIVPKFILHAVDTMSVNGTPTTIAANAEYRYTDGNTITLDNGTGRLFCKTLVPSSPIINKIGGRGLRDFWVAGANHPPGDSEYGLWRAEIKAPVNASYTEFIAVLYATSTATNAMPAATGIYSVDGGMKGVSINGFTVLFAADTDDAAVNSAVYTTDGTSKHIISDLVPGTYTVSKDGVSLGNYTTTSAGTLELDTVAAGTFALSSSGSIPPPTTPGISLGIGGGISIRSGGGATLMRVQ